MMQSNFLMNVKSSNSEIGPYYDDGDVDALTPADRLGRFLIENFVHMDME